MDRRQVSVAITHAPKASILAQLVHEKFPLAETHAIQRSEYWI